MASSTPQPNQYKENISDVTKPQDSVPDPFQLEDPDDPLSDIEEPVLSPSPPRPPMLGPRLESAESVLSSRAGDNVPLGSPYPTDQGNALQLQAPPIIPSPGMLHPSLTPARAPSPDTQAPALFLPGLISPSLFLPIPNTDPLSSLLTKHVPPEIRPTRDLSGAWKHSDFHTLVMTNSWRALARMAKERIVSSSPDDSTLIFELWFLRLNSLARLRLYNQASAECRNLFTVLSNVQPELVRTYIFDEVLPFELEVMRARTRYWNEDPYGYLDDLVLLLRKCKKKLKMASNPTDVEMWKERAVRMVLVMASQLLEMKDHTGAANLLLPLCRENPSNPPTPALLSAVARIYVDAGDLDSAAALFRQAEADPSCDLDTKELNRAIQAMARMDWDMAIENLRNILERDPENTIAANNLSVALLCIGKIEEGIQWLEETMKNSPSIIGSTEPFLFNLATLYELRTARSYEKKTALLVEVAKWAGDGLRANCLKLPTS